MTRKMAVIAPLAIIAMIAFIIVGGEVVALLWNWLLPPLFDFPQITFWQALGLLVLARILFGRLGPSHRPHFRRRLSADERERLWHGMRGRCGAGASAGQSQEQA